MFLHQYREYKEYILKIMNKRIQILFKRQKTLQNCLIFKTSKNVNNYVNKRILILQNLKKLE